MKRLVRAAPVSLAGCMSMHLPAVSWYIEMHPTLSVRGVLLRDQFFRRCARESVAESLQDVFVNLTYAGFG